MCRFPLSELYSACHTNFSDPITGTTSPELDQRQRAKSFLSQSPRHRRFDLGFYNVENTPRKWRTFASSMGNTNRIELRDFSQVVREVGSQDATHGNFMRHYKEILNSHRAHCPTNTRMLLTKRIACLMLIRVGSMPEVHPSSMPDESHFACCLVELAYTARRVARGRRGHSRSRLAAGRIGPAPHRARKIGHCPLDGWRRDASRFVRPETGCARTDSRQPDDDTDRLAGRALHGSHAEHGASR